ncbi:MAG TPA: FCSD flavin-binding domain-containing protein [Beijerinckiaceae bacterium]|jgi:NADPH-dependent 2,4-dienoyl-CoA reductase/sulfur reductase-like enzyme
MTGLPLDRRAFVAGLSTAAATLAAPAALAQAKPKVVVIGGGFGGASAARALHRLGVDVTLIEANASYTACPFSNLVIHGSRPLSAQVFTYDGLKRDGFAVVQGMAESVDTQKKQVLVAGGGAVPYDRLLVAPGVDMRFDALPGYDADAADIAPHAWKAGPQTALLRKQLEAMEDGGVVVMSVPANPYRCPPGPYERASLIAHYLKTAKPRSKLLVLDAKDAFSKQRLFQNAWKEMYPGVLEWVGLAEGGKTTEVDVKGMTVVTEFGRHKGAVLNVIPPQRAGAIAATIGVADRSGWCPIDPNTFESRLVPGVHVIGDACIAGGMPKSAFSANAQAKVCALAMAAMLRGETPAEPKLINTCYSIVAPDYGISVAGVYHPAKGLLADIEGAGGVSPLDAPPEARVAEARYAESWFGVITQETFG